MVLALTLMKGDEVVELRKIRCNYFLLLDFREYNCTF